MKQIETMKSRREFLRDATLFGAGAVLLGALPFGGRAEAQTATPAPPGWLEDQTPGSGAFRYGVPINPYEVGGDAGIERVMDRVKESGADTVAMGVFWPTVEPTKGEVLRLGPVDTAMRMARERGLGVSIYLNGTPDWVHPTLKDTDPDAVQRQFYPPVRTSEEARLFREFVGKVVRRYGTTPLRYKVWNEPNNPHAMRPYTRSAQSAAVYATLLMNGWQAIKAAAPEATVTFGGLSVNDDIWFQWFYDAVKKLPNAAANRFFFDEMDVHCYTQGGSHEYSGAIDDGRATGIRRMPSMKAVMDRNGDTGKKIHVGETGFTTRGNGYFKAVEDARRALFLKQIYSRGRQDFAYVSGVTWFAFHPNPSGPEWTMLDAALNPNRTYQALREATGWNRSIKCYPKIPSDGIVRGRWSVEPLYEGGTPPSDIYHYELYVGGLPKRSAGSAPFDLESWNIPNGKHEVVLAAYSRGGSVYSARPVVLEFRSAKPTITNARPAPGSTTYDRSPNISAIVKDAETNLSKTNIKMWLDGKPITWFGYDSDGDRVYFTPSLGVGNHGVRIEATDSAGNTTPYAWGFYVK